MVQAMINISNEANQILNIVKARHNLVDKSKAIEKVILDYGEGLLEPQLRPEFIKKMMKRQKEKTIYIGSVEDFSKRYGIK
jgi:mannitol/fructose-specific phosphotransferase system IIA component